VDRLRKAGKSEEEAVELAETVDRDRAAYIKKYFGVDWPPRYFYHLMINSTVGEEVVVQTILNSIGMFEQKSA
jgi:cytidylate kinase